MKNPPSLVSGTQLYPSQGDWTGGSTTVTAAITTIGNKAPIAAAPATALASGRFVQSVPYNARSARITILATGGSSLNVAASAVWGWLKASETHYLPMLLATFTGVTSTRTGIAGQTLDSSWYFVEPTITNDYTYDTTAGVVGAAGGVQSMDIPFGGGISHIEVETTRGASSPADAITVLMAFD